MKVGIVLPNWIGDVVMATPALRALRKHFAPPVTITGIMRPYVADVLEGTPWLDETVLYDQHSRERSRRTWPVVFRLRRMRLDKLVVLTNSIRGGLLAFLGGAAERYGYAREGRGWLLTRRLHPPRDGGKFVPVSAVDYYLELAYLAGCREESKQTELRTTEQDEAAAERVWKNLGLPREGRVVTLNPGGAFGAAKHWPSEHFARLARRLVRERGASVLVLCGPAERETAARIVRMAAHPRVCSLVDEPLGIGLSKACVRRSRLLVSTDSGPRHFAAAFGVPAVALFGPTDPRWAVNYNPREVHLQHAMDCQPCGERACPLLHHRCMYELSADCVFEAASSLLKDDRQRAA